MQSIELHSGSRDQQHWKRKMKVKVKADRRLELRLRQAPLGLKFIMKKVNNHMEIVTGNITNWNITVWKLKWIGHKNFSCDFYWLARKTRVSLATPFDQVSPVQGAQLVDLYCLRKVWCVVLSSVVLSRIYELNLWVVHPTVALRCCLFLSSCSVLHTAGVHS